MLPPHQGPREFLVIGLNGHLIQFAIALEAATIHSSYPRRLIGPARDSSDVARPLIAASSILWCGRLIPWRREHPARPSSIPRTVEHQVFFAICVRRIF